MIRALEYMDLRPGAAIGEIQLDAAFLGSCTNARLSDLRLAADYLRGRKVAPGVKAVVVPGSSTVKLAAEAEGLDQVFQDAGFEWRESGCSMCFYAGGVTFGFGVGFASGFASGFGVGLGSMGGVCCLRGATIVGSALVLDFWRVMFGSRCVGVLRLSVAVVGGGDSS